MKRLLKKVSAIALTLVAVMGVSLCVNAACKTACIQESEWNYHRTENCFNGRVHYYPSLYDTEGNVLDWGTCQIIVYRDIEVKRCINCKEITDSRTVFREKCTVTH